MAFDADMSFLSALEPGMEIDGFEIAEKLHAGGTAHLFHVKAPRGADPGFPLVMKIPRVGRDQPAESVISFEAESMILPALHGPHVPRFVAAGELSRVPHVVMEWVEGDSLARRAARAPLATEEVAVLGAALADAVHALHQQNVIHHDVKPDNVILRASGAGKPPTAVLIDYGFARHAYFPDLLAEETRFAAGSAPYVSPEQLSGTRNDPRGDVFALGVVLYELATGQLPFGAPDSYHAMRNRLWAVPPPPRALDHAFPPWLQEIILRCLEPRPEVRYQTAAHVAFDLRHPEQVALTPRATRTERASLATQARLWWRSRQEPLASPQEPKALIGESPVVLVTVDTSHPDDERHPALQWAVRQIAAINLEFRMICVSAVRAPSLGETGGVQDTASGLQLMHKARLRAWIEPLGLPPQRISLHVIESNDPAGTLLDFARHNNVDLIVIGAPAPDEAALAWWRSAASTITANAHCSVHVVRVPTRPRPEWHDWAFNQER